MWFIIIILTIIILIKILKNLEFHPLNLINKLEPIELINNITLEIKEEFLKKIVIFRIIIIIKKNDFLIIFI